MPCEVRSLWDGSSSSRTLDTSSCRDAAPRRRGVPDKKMAACAPAGFAQRRTRGPEGNGREWVASQEGFVSPCQGIFKRFCKHHMAADADKLQKKRSSSTGSRLSGPSSVYSRVASVNLQGRTEVQNQRGGWRYLGTFRIFGPTLSFKWGPKTVRDSVTASQGLPELSAKEFLRAASSRVSRVTAEMSCRQELCRRCQRQSATSGGSWVASHCLCQELRAVTTRGPHFQEVHAVRVWGWQRMHKPRLRFTALASISPARLQTDPALLGVQCLACREPAAPWGSECW